MIEEKKKRKEEEAEPGGTVGLQMLINPFCTDASKLRVPVRRYSTHQQTCYFGYDECTIILHFSPGNWFFISTVFSGHVFIKTQSVIDKKSEPSRTLRRSLDSLR
ncbi:hypothetical protein ATANTOWER_030931 [Ataeniobius toweri]|uniref:Uncharacterized protein n=1 Tax=Ataeniobius toweri TaxID=208326 RepID=A0ABU7A9G6_9TELE|nr:hypothetical protein [Ataeniobius toweri]